MLQPSYMKFPLAKFAKKTYKRMDFHVLYHRSANPPGGTVLCRLAGFLWNGIHLCLVIHAPARGATCALRSPFQPGDRFNPRPREGGDRNAIFSLCCKVLGDVIRERLFF